MHILGFLGLSVLELGRGTQQTDRHTPEPILMPPPLRGWDNNQDLN